LQDAPGDGRVTAAATPVSMTGDAWAIDPDVFDRGRDGPAPVAAWADLTPNAPRGDASVPAPDPHSAAPLEARAPARAPPLVMDHQTSDLLSQVNLYVNRSIRFVSDTVQYGVDDYWTLPLDAGGSGAGECKDYVLEKRRALIAAGISADDLSIAIVRTNWGEAHAVLLVATDSGELVMDSLSSQIRPWRQAPYQWIERQAPGRQLDWVRILASSRRNSSLIARA